MSDFGVACALVTSTAMRMHMSNVNVDTLVTPTAVEMAMVSAGMAHQWTERTGGSRMQLFC